MSYSNDYMQRMMSRRNEVVEWKSDDAPTTITFIKFKQTTPVSPSQWEGVTDDGKHFYARYRFGIFTAELANQITHFRHFFVKTKENAWDGEMSTKEMFTHLKQAGIEINFPQGFVITHYSTNDEGNFVISEVAATELL